MKRQTIIVAGGSGTRMGTTVPKQFIEVGGKPILLWTLEAFAAFDAEMEIILVLPAGQMEQWTTICAEHHCTIKHTVVAGGATRFESVRNGLCKISADAVVAVHDGVRPFVSQHTLERCFAMAMEQGSAVPCVDVVDSLRKTTTTGNEACDRSQFKAVQTPQVFRGDVLLQAYEQPFVPTFTDDASVVEQSGYAIHLVEGNRENIKITTPLDLQFAEMILKNRETHQ